MQFVKSDLVRRSDPVRVEYAGVTRANPNLAWKLFSDFRRWRRFSDIYGEIRWVSGAPWSVGSRLRIDLVRPVRTTVDHVIIACSPGERVGWIDHAFSNTMEQWVAFQPRAEGGTLVETWAEMVGPAVTLGGRPVRKLLKTFIELWYSRFCRECDHVWEKEQTATVV